MLTGVVCRIRLSSPLTTLKMGWADSGMWLLSPGATEHISVFARPKMMMTYDILEGEGPSLLVAPTV